MVSVATAKVLRLRARPRWAEMAGAPIAVDQLGLRHLCCGHDCDTNASARVKEASRSEDVHQVPGVGNKHRVTLV